MHPSPHLFDAVARGEGSRELLDELLKEHLAALCPVCAETLAGHEARQARAGAQGGPSFLRAEPSRDRLEPLRRRLGLRELELRAREREARAWVRRAVKLPPDVRRDKVANAYVRYRGPLFCLLLLEEARGRIPGDPAEAESLADAVLASNHKTALYQPDPEVEAPALAVRGNARRALGRLLAAEGDLAEARRLLDSPGVTDPETPAELLAYLGSLRKDQGRFEEASHHLHRAAALYEVLRDRKEAARAHLALGIVHYRVHQFDAAVSSSERTLELLDAGEDDWLRAYAHYNLAWFLHGSGELDRAEVELAAHEELLAACGKEAAQHVVWLKARIAWSREDLAAAQRLYTEARARALDRGIAWDAGLVGLELALVHLARGRTAQVRKLAREALEVFAEQQVERETRAALDLLEAAARRDAFTRELLEQTITSIERAAQGRSAAVQGSGTR